LFKAISKNFPSVAIAEEASATEDLSSSSDSKIFFRWRPILSVKQCRYGFLRKL